MYNKNAEIRNYEITFCEEEENFIESTKLFAESPVSLCAF